MTEKPQHPELPPDPIEPGGIGVETSQELPIVVLGEADSLSSQPRARLLQGRFPANYFILPAMGLNIIAGAIAVFFSLHNPEWTPWSIGTTWFVLYIWTWFYGVAFKYHRSLLWWSSLFAILGLSVLIAFFCIDKAAAQYTPGPNGLMWREGNFSLWISAVLTMLASLSILSHFVFFGRGYREKK